MAKILILEDDMNRMKQFKVKFRGHSIYHFDNANEAIEELKRTKFDLICLDHDLGGKQMEWDEDNNGMMVAEYLKENPQECKTVVHSFNNIRGPLMADIITNAVYIPGFWKI